MEADLLGVNTTFREKKDQRFGYFFGSIEITKDRRLVIGYGMFMIFHVLGCDDSTSVTNLGSIPS